MYHVELRQFPHNFCRFNMSEEQLRADLLDRWLRGEPVEFGERRWDPRQAAIAVLEGPELSLPELAMGRGWRNARRRGRDVTATLLASPPAQPATAPGQLVATAPREPAAAQRPATASGQPPVAAAAAEAAAPLLEALGERDAVALLQAWRIALERHPDRSPSECLALAEQLVAG